MRPLLAASFAFGAALAALTVIPPPPLPAAAACAGLAAVAVALRPGTPSSAPPRSLLAWALLGLWLGFLAVARQPVGPVLRGKLCVDGAVAAGALGREVDVVLRAVQGPGDDAWGPASGRVRVTFPERAPPPGSRWTVCGIGRPWTRSWLPGAPDPVAAARLGRVRTWVWADRAESADPAPIRFPIGGDRHGLANALWTGDRSTLDADVAALLQRTGTAHLLSVSGFHVATVAGLTGGALAILLRAAAAVRSRGLPLWPAALVGAACGAAYTELAGAGIPGRRAAALFALLTLGRALGRSPSALPLLAAIGAALAWKDPPAIATPGFQLSFGAVAGLLVLAPAWMARVPPDLPRALRWPIEALIGSLAATLGTLPASAWWFQELAPTGPLANLFALPWTSAVVMPLAMVGAIVPEPLRSSVESLTGSSVEVLLAGLRALDAAPWHPAVGPLGAALLAAPLLLGRRLVTSLGCVAVALGLRVQPIGVFAVEQLDVGQGAATLLWLPDGRRWLVDGGPAGEALVRYLRRRGVGRIDVVVATHPHLDHTGGLGPVLDAIEVGVLWRDDPAWSDGLAEAARRASVPIVRPDRALHPDPSFRSRDPNDRSLVLALGTAFLGVGDCGRRAERQFADRVAPADVLLVGHHGSSGASGRDFLEAVRPSVALIGVGRQNRYRHPGTAALERLDAIGAEVWRTDLSGTVHVDWREGRLDVFARPAGAPAVRSTTPWGPRPPSPDPPEAGNGGRTG